MGNCFKKQTPETIQLRNKRKYPDSLNHSNHDDIDVNHKKNHKKKGKDKEENEYNQYFQLRSTNNIDFLFKHQFINLKDNIPYEVKQNQLLTHLIQSIPNNLTMKVTLYDEYKSDLLSYTQKTVSFEFDDINFIIALKNAMNSILDVILGYKIPVTIENEKEMISNFQIGLVRILASGLLSSTTESSSTESHSESNMKSQMLDKLTNIIMGDYGCSYIKRMFTHPNKLLSNDNNNINQNETLPSSSSSSESNSCKEKLILFEISKSKSEQIQDERFIFCNICYRMHKDNFVHELHDNVSLGTLLFTQYGSYMFAKKYIVKKNDKQKWTVQTEKTNNNSISSSLISLFTTSKPAESTLLTDDNDETSIKNDDGDNNNNNTTVIPLDIPSELPPQLPSLSSNENTESGLINYSILHETFSNTPTYIQSSASLILTHQQQQHQTDTNNNTTDDNNNNGSSQSGFYTTLVI